MLERDYSHLLRYIAYILLNAVYKNDISVRNALYIIQKVPTSIFEIKILIMNVRAVFTTKHQINFVMNLKACIV